MGDQKINTMKQAGLWIEFRKAELIDPKKGIISTIISQIEEVQPGTGSRSNVPYGPMDKKSDRKILERRENQIKAYFGQILDLLGHIEELVIFGPGEIKRRLVNYLREEHSFHGRVRGIRAADQMTERQKIAYVKDYFRSS